MKILLSGANGFIGKPLLKILEQNKHKVYAFSRSSNPRQESNIEWLACDILDQQKTAELIQTIKPDALIHLAWYTEHGKFWSADENYDWVTATINLTKIFALSGGQRAVFAGSCAEYDWDYGYCKEYLTPTRPNTVYGKSKLATQQITEAICDSYGVKYAWGRIFFPYGPGEINTKLIPSIIASLKDNATVICNSQGTQYRDFIHINDVASAFLHLVENDTATGIFNISSGIPISIREIVSKCIDIYASEQKPAFGAQNLNETPLLVGDNTQLCNTGWVPTTDIDVGLNDYIKNFGNME